MPDANEPFLLPIATAAAVLAATGRPDALPLHLLEPFRRWLTDEWQGAVRRSSQVRLTQEDVRKFDKHYLAFRETIDSLQNRTLPPPLMPAADGMTAWDDWRDLYEQFGYAKGRREERDWLLIGALLALRCLAIGKDVPAAPGRGPWMRYLKAALSELSAYAPAKSGSYFSAPTPEALKHKLPSLRRLSLRQAARHLTKTVEGWVIMPSK